MQGRNKQTNEQKKREENSQAKHLRRRLRGRESSDSSEAYCTHISLTCRPRSWLSLFCPLLLQWEHRRWRISFSVSLRVDKLNKASITARVHQCLSSLLSMENFIHGLARCCHTGDSPYKTAFMFTQVCVCVSLSCVCVCRRKHRATWLWFIASVCLFTQTTHWLILCCCISDSVLWDVWISFRPSVPFAPS